MAIKNISPSNVIDPAVGSGVNGDASSSNLSLKPDGAELESSSKSCTLGDVNTISISQAEESNEPTIPFEPKVSTS